MKIAARGASLTSVRPTSLAGVGFGRIFSDRMFAMEYSPCLGWHDARIQPLQEISLHPACCVFHYGAEVFEGLKAYRRADGDIGLFRVIDNGKRLASSCERMSLPVLDPQDFVEAVNSFVRAQADWVPDEPGTSLYLRPFVICTDTQLGVHGITNAAFYIIASPVGSYYPNGLAPVRIAIERDDVRAVRGGTGYAKCGGNYAAAARATVRAEKAGYDQVLWLDGVERRYIEEVGAMNVMFKIGGRIVTPGLTGSILPGITRSTCITLLREMGYEVEERQLDVAELIEAAESGALEEAWGCGTAAVISPIGVLRFGGEDHAVRGGGIGPVSQALYDAITGIQYGRIADTHGWVTRLAPAQAFPCGA